MPRIPPPSRQSTRNGEPDGEMMSSTVMYLIIPQLFVFSSPGALSFSDPVVRLRLPIERKTRRGNGANAPQVARHSLTIPPCARSPIPQNHVPCLAGDGPTTTSTSRQQLEIANWRPNLRSRQLRQALDFHDPLPN